jgi:RNA polymerase sigma factor (sigma-70 family)
MVDQADAEIYEKYADELLRFATVLVGPGAAPDILAEAFFQALKSKAWPTVVNHRAFLYRCVVTEVRSSRRSFIRRRSLEARTAPSEAVRDPESQLEVAAALMQLSPRQRAVVYLSYWEDLTNDDIARFLDISAGSVHRHLARARTNLRRLLHD